MGTSKYGYKFDARVVKAANMIEDNFPDRCLCCYKENSNPRFRTLILLRRLSFPWILNEIFYGC